MKTLITISFICFFSNITFSQDKHDYMWPLGYSPNNQEEFFGGSMINFHTEDPEVTFFDIPIPFLTNSSLSDSEGNLLLYCNGLQVANQNHEIMMQGDSINFGIYYESSIEVGYPAYQSIISLQQPNNDSMVYIFHLRKEDLNPTRNKDFLQTTININADNGFGKVIQKNQLLLEDSFIDQFTAVRHGNGRDWWLVLPQAQSNKFFFFLFSPAGVSFSHEQEIGEGWNQFDWAGQTVFSPDGTKYIRANPYNDIQVYDFDRCSGLFSNPVLIEIPDNDPIINAVGTTVSPNSELLYIMTPEKIYQYELTNENIAMTRKTVIEWEEGMFSYPSFFTGMLAPNNKIYITPSYSSTALHIIHNPNEVGTNSNVEPFGLDLPTYHHNQVPNFPHFRLYDLPNSPCDTLGINDPVPTEEEIVEKQAIKVFPNPTQNHINITFPAAFTGKIYLTDLTGKFVNQVLEVRETTAVALPLENMPHGVYILNAIDEEHNFSHQEKIIVH